MNHAAESRLQDDALRQCLQVAVNEHFPEPPHIVLLQRRTSPYASSYRLEEVKLLLSNGSSLELMVKHVSRDDLPQETLHAKPQFLFDLHREAVVYQHILAGSQLGFAACYGTLIGKHARGCQLLLERVEGSELYQIGELKYWQEAARHLVRMHHELTPLASRIPPEARRHLLRYDEDLLWIWIERAVRFQEHRSPAAAEVLKRLQRNYRPVIERLTASEQALIHGEFYPSHLLLQQQSDSLRICVIDWEMAGFGPALIDLAALVSGNWTPDQRRSLCDAYFHQRAVHAAGDQREELMTDLKFCQLHLAVQWLGWSAEWSPPTHQAHDWLSDAIQLGRELKLV